MYRQAMYNALQCTGRQCTMYRPCNVQCTVSWLPNYNFEIQLVLWDLGQSADPTSDVLDVEIGVEIG